MQLQANGEFFSVGFFPLDALKQARKEILEEILIVRLILTTEIQVWNENRDTLTNSSS